MRIGPRTDPRGFSVIELLVVFTTIGIIATIVVPQLLMAYERTRQRRSIADMRSIAVANGTYRVDNDEYAGGLDDLTPIFMKPVPPRDAWITLQCPLSGFLGLELVHQRLQLILKFDKGRQVFRIHHDRPFGDPFDLSLPRHGDASLDSRCVP